MSEAVVLTAFRGVGEHRVGLLDLLEAVFSVGLIAAIWVVLSSQTTESVLQRFLIRVAIEAEHLVVIALPAHVGPVPLAQGAVFNPTPVEDHA